MRKAKNKIPSDGYHNWTFVRRDEYLFDLIDMVFVTHIHIDSLISLDGEVYRKPIHTLNVRHFPASSDEASEASCGLTANLKYTFIIYLKDNELDMKKLCNKLVKYFNVQ